LTLFLTGIRCFIPDPEKEREEDRGAARGHPEEAFNGVLRKVKKRGEKTLLRSPV